jgi:hypothetical protein
MADLIAGLIGDYTPIPYGSPQNVGMSWACASDAAWGGSVSDAPVRRFRGSKYASSDPVPRTFPQRSTRAGSQGVE